MQQLKQQVNSQNYEIMKPKSVPNENVRDIEEIIIPPGKSEKK